MSVARSEFLRSLSGIREAIALEPVAQGATGAILSPSISVLRRGILIAGLIALETFVRDRTVEVLRNLERWPRAYEELPEKLRIAARLNALSHLQQFAKMLKRQDDDYEAELKTEIAKMSSGDGTAIQFTKFVAGDFTGNLSDTGLKELLGSLQVADCWATFRIFSSAVGLGVPSVQEIVKGTVRKRHRSAHSQSYVPTATEIAELPSDLLCIAMCFDVSTTASLEQSLAVSQRWAAGETAWRDGVILYFTEPHSRGVKVTKEGSARALRIVGQGSEVGSVIPRPSPGNIAVVVNHSESGIPQSWTIM